MKFVKLFILSFFFCYAAQSQIFQLVKTPIKWSVGGFDSLFLPQHDTLKPQDKAKAWMTIKDTAIYVWKQTKWVPISSNGNLVAGTGGGGEINSGTVAQLRALSTTTGRSYTSTDFGGGNWTDIGVKADDDFRVDDGATLILSANNHWLQRQIEGEVYPEWWGAVAGDNVSDTAAFGKMTRFALANNKNIHLGAGTYDLKGPNTATAAWIVPGRTSNGSAIKITGEGSRTSILKGVNSSVVLQYGTATNDVLNGLLSSFSVQADSTVNGINIVSSAPTSGAFSIVNDIYIKNTKDGLKLVGSAENPSSNYSNTFTSIRIERYWGLGVSVSGVYNSFKDLFIVAPSGGSPGKGGLTLALLVEGSENSFDKMQTEDQINIVGNNNHITASAIEIIKKDAAYSGIGGVGFRISGSGNSIDGFSLQAFNKNIFSYVGTIYGTYTSLRNISYNNLSSTLFDVLYPILPQGGSSGTMDNVLSTPVAGNVSIFYPDNFSFNSNFADWSLRNVLGYNGIFSRDNHLRIIETNPGALDKTAGGTVTGYTTAIQLESPQLKLTSLLFDEATHKIANAAGTDYDNFITIPAQGKRSLQNVENIAANTGNFTGVNSVSGNFTGFTHASQLETDLMILKGITYNRTSMYIDPSHGSVSAIPVMLVDTTTFGKSVINLPNAGSGSFAGNVAGKPAVADTQFITRKQNTDSLDARYAASAFFLRTAGGTGDSLISFPNANTAIVKRIKITGATKDTVNSNDTTLAYTINGTGVNGTFSFTGNSSTTTFTIPLSIAGLTTTSKVFLDPNGTIGASVDWIDKSTESITIHYLTAPTTGVKSINYFIIP